MKYLFNIYRFFIVLIGLLSIATLFAGIFEGGTSFSLSEISLLELLFIIVLFFMVNKSFHLINNKNIKTFLYFIVKNYAFFALIMASLVYLVSLASADSSSANVEGGSLDGLQLLCMAIFVIIVKRALFNLPVSKNNEGNAKMEGDDNAL